MRSLLLVSCGFLLMGCGGSGGGGTTPPPPPVTGEWAGTWGGPTPPPGDTGTLNIEIEADGDITGTAHNNGRNEDGTITGSIGQDGEFSFVIDYPSHDCEVLGTFAPIGTSHEDKWRSRSEEYNRTVHIYSFWVDLQKVP
jgi:hypothetical protein